jgi:hypothetical protein
MYKKKLFMHAKKITEGKSIIFGLHGYGAADIFIEFPGGPLHFVTAASTASKLQVYRLTFFFVIVQKFDQRPA